LHASIDKHAAELFALSSFMHKQVEALSVAQQKLQGQHQELGGLAGDLKGKHRELELAVQDVQGKHANLGPLVQQHVQSASAGSKTVDADTLERLKVLERWRDEARTQLRQLHDHTGALGAAVDHAHAEGASLRKAHGDHEDAMKALQAQHADFSQSLPEQRGALSSDLEAAVERLVAVVSELKRKQAREFEEIQGHLGFLQASLEEAEGKCNAIQTKMESVVAACAANSRDQGMTAGLQAQLLKVVKERDHALEDISRLRRAEAEQGEAERRHLEAGELQNYSLQEERRRSRTFEMALGQAKAELDVAQARHRLDTPPLSAAGGSLQGSACGLSRSSSRRPSSTTIAGSHVLAGPFDVRWFQEAPLSKQFVDLTPDMDDGAEVDLRSPDARGVPMYSRT